MQLKKVVVGKRDLVRWKVVIGLRLGLDDISVQPFDVHRKKLSVEGRKSDDALFLSKLSVDSLVEESGGGGNQFAVNNIGLLVFPNKDGNYFLSEATSVSYIMWSSRSKVDLL